MKLFTVVISKSGPKHCISLKVYRGGEAFHFHYLVMEPILPGDAE
jgi:hypothetical protein